MNVVYIPGLLGTVLGYSRGPLLPAQAIWPDGAAILSGGLARLQLDADGVSLGPMAGTIPMQALGILGPSYGPLAYAMRQYGWSVSPMAYDWRLSLASLGPAVAAAAVAAYGDQPFALVAHSLGGLVAVAAYAALRAAGRDAQVTRMVTIGTPHYGSFEAVRIWGRLASTYRWIVAAQGWGLHWPGTIGPAYIDQILWSWPSLYEVMPCRDYGPLFASDPNQAVALYDYANYPGGDDTVFRSRMVAAPDVQDNIRDVYPVGRTAHILGVGHRTPDGLPNPTRPTDGTAYHTTYGGDGSVTTEEGRLPGCSAATIYSSHILLPLTPRVWAAVGRIVPDGLRTDVVL
jgi:pimeloyl-ACP methyl ester carboxylesterase